MNRVFDLWKKNNTVQFKVEENVAFQRAIGVLLNEFEKEKEIEQEAKDMVEKLERQNPGSFEPHKMYLMIKKKLAQEKGVIL